MRKIITGFILLLVLNVVQGQGNTALKDFHLYHPEANASAEIATAVKEAAASGKHVLIQIGGNWCIWCMRFNDFVNTDTHLDSLVKANYVVYHLNYSKENKNEALLAKYQFPQRFGFPVFLILDGKGNLIHTQNSSYLEEGKSYSKEKVEGFFMDWTHDAVDPAKQQF